MKSTSWTPDMNVLGICKAKSGIKKRIILFLETFPRRPRPTRRGQFGKLGARFWHVWKRLPAPPQAVRQTSRKFRDALARSRSYTYVFSWDFQVFGLTRIFPFYSFLGGCHKKFTYYSSYNGQFLHFCFSLGYIIRLPKNLFLPWATLPLRVAMARY